MPRCGGSITVIFVLFLTPSGGQANGNSLFFFASPFSSPLIFAKKQIFWVQQSSFFLSLALFFLIITALLPMTKETVVRIYGDSMVRGLGVPQCRYPVTVRSWSGGKIGNPISGYILRDVEEYYRLSPPTGRRLIVILHFGSNNIGCRNQDRRGGEEADLSC